MEVLGIHQISVRVENYFTSDASGGFWPTFTCDQESMYGEFPGGPVDRTWRFHCWDLGSVPGQGTKILQAVWPN